ncbi:MAG TPA: hypothetical protein VFQ61_39015 [Polyangiaceae bacterium]|nr:hypothetical protein [Polyangiaceae bacterium]
MKLVIPSSTFKLATSIAAVLMFACASDASKPEATGGSSSLPGQGGTTTSSGGIPGAGGAAPGASGAATSGGGVSTGGTRAISSAGPGTSGGTSPNEGGSVSGGTSSGGGTSGGTAPGGSLSGGNASAGSSNGGASGGSANAQGGASSSAGEVGSSGAAGASGQGGTINDPKLAGDFDGALIAYPCGAAHSGFDCDNIGCKNGQVTHTQTFKMGGVSGTVYDVTFRVRGVVEAYNYVGGTRDAGNDSINKTRDLFLRGGAPQPGGANGYDYDVYELNVSPPVSGAPATYFLNSVSNAENPHTSSATLHLSFDIDYTKTIQVGGGATITVKQYDSNCKSVMNCGPSASGSCPAPRKVSLEGASPAPPTTFTQPYQMPTGAYGQWLFFDVTSVTVAR